MSYQDHPGFTAVDCPIRLKVAARRTDGGGGGYACAWSGGQCLPGPYCDARREEEEELQLRDKQADN